MRVENNWYVDEEGLASYLKAKESEREQRRIQLQQERTKEYYSSVRAGTGSHRVRSVFSTAALVLLFIIGTATFGFASGPLVRVAQEAMFASPELSGSSFLSRALTFSETFGDWFSGLFSNESTSLLTHISTQTGSKVHEDSSPESQSAETPEPNIRTEPIPTVSPTTIINNPVVERVV